MCGGILEGLVGGLGFAPSANIGSDIAIFEAVHGSAPKYAGKNVINPTAMMLSGVMMLRHLGEFEAARTMEDAILYTIGEGKALTRDVVGDAKSVSTTAFTEAILNNYGKRPADRASRDYKPVKRMPSSNAETYAKVKSREVVGLDVFVESSETPDQIGKTLEANVAGLPLKLKMISNRGTKLYPSAGAITDTVNHWRCRFMLAEQKQDVSPTVVTDLLARVEKSYRWMHIEKLQQFDGKAGFTKAQGED